MIDDEGKRPHYTKGRTKFDRLTIEKMGICEVMNHCLEEMESLRLPIKIYQKSCARSSQSSDLVDDDIASLEDNVDDFDLIKVF